MSQERRHHEGHDELEAHDDRRGAFRLHVPSPLTPRAEQVMTEVIGCAIDVHRNLGPGFLERIYQQAMCVAFNERGLSYEREKPVAVSYRGVSLTGQRVDLLVEDEVIVELKAVVRLDEIHRSQLISYLRTTGLRGGLLINFRTALLKHGLRRVVL